MSTLEREAVLAGSLNTPLLRHYDVLVVGGGICGAAAAYEASRRGLSVLLVERGDFGAATSFNSMKVVHGGLRYMQDADFGRVVRSLGELRTLSHVAPHLVRPLRCELALGGTSRLFRLKFRAGLALYTALRASVGLLDRRDVPSPRCGYPGWYDGFIERTEQYLLDLLHTAVALGEGRVAVRNYCRIEAFERQDGRVVAARLSGLGAIGVGVVLECVGTQLPGQPVGLAMNLVCDGLSLAPDQRAMGLLHPGDGRFVFVVPWRGRSIVGTYERDYPHDPEAPLELESAWIREFLSWLAPAHPELARLETNRITLLHAGLLPRDRADSPRLSGTDRVVRHADGRLRLLLTKYTTARALASRAVEMALRDVLRRPVPRSRRSLPRLTDRRRLVAAFNEQEPQLAAPVLDGFPDGPSIGELYFSAEHEQARTLGDVLLRRTSAASAGYPGDPFVHSASLLLQSRLGWSEQERVHQVQALREEPGFARELLLSL